MGTDLKIYEQSISYVGYRRNILYKEIATVWNNELIEKIQEKGQRNWYVSSECGSEFELLGSELLEFANEIKKYDNEFDITQVCEDDYYRCEVSY